MKRIIAITALGYDQPGIVASLTNCLYTVGCNLEESSMTLLRHDFAIIMLVTIAPDMSTEDVYQALQPAIDQFNLTITVRGLTEEETEDASDTNTANHVLSIYGLDKKGIVCKITSVLANHEINITGSQTRTHSDDNNTVYSFLLEIYVPYNCKNDTLMHQLQTVCDELSVDFSLTPIDKCQEM